MNRRGDGIVEQLATCAKHVQFRKLLAVRLVSQTGDGLFQIGLATLFFFNPQNATTASGVALAFAVMLLPFTVVGPFAGPLLDRWRRRNVLAICNGLRLVFAFALAVLVFVAPGSWVIYVLALVTLGINRFLLSALSAGLPHTLPKNLLVMANSITPTLGSIATVVGGGVGLVLGLTAPSVRNTLALVLAGLAFAGAALLALRFRRDDLGPTSDLTGETNGAGERASLTSEIGRILRELVDGARYVIERGTPGAALGIMAIHRFLYGANFIALILIARNLLADPANADDGLAKFALLAGVSFVGNALAIVTTPIAHRSLTPHMWIVACLAMSLFSQVLLTATYREPWIFVSCVLMGFGVQGAKIAVDTIVQSDTADRFRGRAFSLYDMLFNMAFVSAAALAALALPDVGWSRAVFVALGVVYVVATVGYALVVRRLGGAPRPVTCSSS